MILLSLVIAVFTIISFLGEYSFFDRLDVRANHRLLNSAKAWSDYSFWKLGGFLNFQYGYAGPDHWGELFIYRFHVPLYAIPHWFGFSLAQEDGF